MDDIINTGNFSPRERPTGGGGKMQITRSKPRLLRRGSQRPNKIHETTRNVHDDIFSSCFKIVFLTFSGDLSPAEAHAGLHGPLLLFLRLPRVHHHQLFADVRGQVGARVEQHRSGRTHGLLPGPASCDENCRHISGK